MKFEFQKNHPRGPFECVPLSEWQSWQWQLKNSLRRMVDFEKVYSLSADEKNGFAGSKNIFQIRSTPYYVVLGSRENSKDPIRLIQTPDFKELESQFQQMRDPLAENKNSVTSHLVHRYADRVLFLVTDLCSVYCRFCTRKHFTGKNQARLSEDEYSKALEYIRKHTGIREVILSGGDPLTLSDDVLEQIFKDLRQIEHIEIIRVGSRMPTVNPFRMTTQLLNIFKKYKPVYLMTHFNHPKEITYEASQALEHTADSGVPIFNQMVFLNGINNHPAVVQALSRRLLYLRVKPYYMFQCDPSLGTDHLRTSLTDSLEIQRELWGHLSGLAMANLSVDIPHGGGKVSFVPNFLVSQNSNVWNLKGFDDIEHEYVDPFPQEIQKPTDLSDYIEEWNNLKYAKEK